ncbi:hypothetical protein ACS0TY_010980 [Phlomoides rotata]
MTRRWRSSYLRLWTPPFLSKTDFNLPSHLETRFQKLKSFPSSTVKPTSLSSKSFHHLHPPEFRNNETVNEAKDLDSSEEKNGEDSEKMPSTCLKKSPEAKLI